MCLSELPTNDFRVKSKLQCGSDSQAMAKSCPFQQVFTAAKWLTPWEKHPKLCQAADGHGALSPGYTVSKTHCLFPGSASSGPSAVQAPCTKAVGRHASQLAGRMADTKRSRMSSAAGLGMQDTAPGLHPHRARGSAQCQLRIRRHHCLCLERLPSQLVLQVRFIGILFKPFSTFKCLLEQGKLALGIFLFPLFKKIISFISIF